MDVAFPQAAQRLFLVAINTIFANDPFVGGAESDTAERHTIIFRRFPIFGRVLGRIFRKISSFTHDVMQIILLLSLQFWREVFDDLV